MHIVNVSSMSFKKIYHLLQTTATVVALALPIMFAACSEDEAVNGASSGMPITVAAQINGMHLTRAGYSSTALPDSFALHIEQDHTSEGIGNYWGIKMKNEGSATANVWNAYSEGVREIMVWRNDVSPINATIFAYTIQNEDESLDDISEELPVRVSLKQNDADSLKFSDFLYYKGTNINPDSDGKISVPFSHKFSKLLINFNYGTDLADYTDKQLSSVLVGRTLTSGTYNCVESTLNIPYNDKKDKIEAYIDNTNKMVEAIIPPQTVAVSIIFKLQLDSEKTQKCYIELPSTSFAENTQYTVSITIGRDRVQGGDFTVSPWGDGNSSNVEDLVTE